MGDTDKLLETRRLGKENSSHRNTFQNPWRWSKIYRDIYKEPKYNDTAPLINYRVPKDRVSKITMRDHLKRNHALTIVRKILCCV